jgi:hemoglobin
MLRTGRYKGNPMAAHLRHRARITPAMFGRWLALWDEVVSETLPRDAATALRGKAARIAERLQFALALRPASAQPAGRVPA